MDAAERFADTDRLPNDLAFVDLETTGGNASYHRVTEVGIVRMTAGVVVEQWSSLVNPECRIPGTIESFTGITNEMVAAAPRFADLASVILEKLRGPVFVAHNARFDYAFLRSEFRRLGLVFSSPVLCTVRLSRRLFPEHPRHGLDSVIERHQLVCSARHRALGDAQVIADFWSKLLIEVPRQKLAATTSSVIGANRLPPHLPADLADELPDGPGVYRFFGEHDVLLYIGKSQSLRTRILGHFAAEHADSAERRKAGQTRRIDWVETAGDLGAQLKEAQWIKQQKPLYNKRLKPRADVVTLEAADNDAGFVVKRVDAVIGARGKAAPGAAGAACFGLFQSHKDARKALTDIARAHGLCSKILGLEDGPGSCFGFQVGNCRGACVGKEPLLLHRTRLVMALSALKLKPWPFPGRIALQEGRSEYHVLDHWSYLGTARDEDELADVAARDSGEFDVDVYRILVRHLAKHPRVDWRALP